MFPFCVLTILVWSKRMPNVNNPVSFYYGRLLWHSTEPIHGILCPHLWLMLYCTTLTDGLCCVCVCLCVGVLVSQSCLTLCDPMDFFVHGILQARILEWVAIPFSRDLPDTGIEPRSPELQAHSLPSEPMGYNIIQAEIQKMLVLWWLCSCFFWNRSPCEQA